MLTERLAGLVLLAVLQRVEANTRCYSCAPCTEMDYYSSWTDLGRWELDCPLDRYCMKITGFVQDNVYGYGREVSIRGCPWISLLARLEEGCAQHSLDIAGLGRVVGEVCLCGDHLCNSSPGLAAWLTLPTTFISFLLLSSYSSLAW